MEAYAGAGSRNAAEKERSHAGAAGSMKAEKERALLTLNNLELDEENARAGSKTEKEKEEEKTVLQNPMPLEFPLPLGPPGAEQEEPGQFKAGAGKRRKKTFRLGMEYIDFVAENPLPPLYQPVPSFDLGFIELQERFVAKQMAEREARENILKQLEEFGYADVEIEAFEAPGYVR